MKLLRLLFILSIILTRVGAQNDNFTDALTLTGTAGAVAFDLENTTTEPGEAFSNGSVWYRWVAPSPGALTLTTTPAVENIRFRSSAYQGNTLPTLTELGAINQADDFNLFRAIVDPGDEILIRIGKEQLTADSNLGTLNYELTAGPENDSRLNPLDLGSAQAVDFDPDNTGTTRHPSEWNGNNFFDSGTLWFTWQAPDDGLLYLHAASDNFSYDAKLNLHTGDGGKNDQPVAILQTERPDSTRFPVTAGQRYLFSYSTSDDLRPGSAKVSLRLLSIDPAHQHTQPIELTSGNDQAILGAFCTALADPSVTFDSFHEEWQDPPSASLWYSWQAPSSGPYLIKRTTGFARFGVWLENGNGLPTLVAQDLSGKLTFDAVAGSHYLISALNPSSIPPSSTFFQWELVSGAAPPNDQFANRTHLGNSGTWEVEGDNTFASSEADEPQHDGMDAQRSLWYSWTAPSSGPYLLDNPLASVSTRIAVYSGEILASLAPISSGPYRTIFSAEAGTTYQIVVDGTAQRPGSFNLTLEPASPPANDNFADRITLPGTRPIFNENLRYATMETGEQSLSFASTSASVWFEWTPIATQTLYLPPPDFALFQSDDPDPSLTQLEELLPGSRFLESITVFRGRTYYFQLRARGNSQTDPDFVDTAREYLASPFPRTPNTLFETRNILPPLTSLRVGAAPYGLERQTVADSVLLNSLTAWWSWTAPESGLYLTRPTEGDTTTGGSAVFTGEEFTSLSEIASGDSRGLYFEATQGTTYHLASFLQVRNGGWLGLDLQKVESPPSNDQFATPLDFGSSLSIRHLQTNHLATSEFNEPLFEDSHALRSTWFQWTAPFDGQMNFTAQPDSRISFFSGEEITNLIEVASASESITAGVSGGQTYRLRLDSPDPQAIDLSGTFIYLPYPNNAFADAIEWSGSPQFGVGNADLCDLEENEPRPSGSSSSSGSVWWKWTPSETGATTINLDGDLAYFTIYRGTSLSDLRPIVTHSSVFHDLRFHALADQVYWLQFVARSQVGQRNFSFTLDQDLQAPDNDLFENALPLSGSNFSVEITPELASFQENEPSSNTLSIWYRWQVPESTLYSLKTTSGTALAYRGSNLENLEQVREFHRETMIQGVAGEEIMIAFNHRDPQASTLTLSKVEGPPNDDFANRTNLGAMEEVSIEVNLFSSTFETQEPEILTSDAENGTVWWQWTAPRDGLVSLSADVFVFTGSSLESLTPLSQTEMTRFQAQAGQTYQFATLYHHPFSQNDTFRLSIRTIPNDDLANPLTILQLPYFWEGELTNATFERFEDQTGDGSAWWQWTAPATGTVSYESEWPIAMVPVRSDILKLPRLSNSFSGTIDALEGETYLIRLTGPSFNAPTTVAPTSFSLEWVDQEPPLGSSSVQISDLSNPFELAGGAPGKLLKRTYLWTPSQSGTISLSSPNTTSFFPTLHRVPPDGDLEPIFAFVNNWSQDNRFPVEQGTTYELLISYRSTDPTEWTLHFGPENDLFADAIRLPSRRNLVQAGTTVGAGREPSEPPFTFSGPNRSVWYSWTAPQRGSYCLSTDQYSCMVFAGNQIDGLSPASEKSPRIFHAEAGQTYHFVVEAGSGGGPFFLYLDPVNSFYDDWKESFFGDSRSDSTKPNFDPDGDGLTNLLEMALGKDPLTRDGSLPIFIQPQEAGIVLSVMREADLEGVEITFEVSNDLKNWYQPVTLETWSEPAPNQLETLYVRIPLPEGGLNLPAFTRLKVSLLPENH